MKTKLFLILSVFFALSSYAQVYMYGTTNSDGANGLGTIYRTDQNGQNFQKLFDFTSTTGGNPSAGVTLANGKLYGFTNFQGQIVNAGAAIALGSFYEFDPLTNQLNVLTYIDDMSDIGNTYNFAPLLASNGKLYSISYHAGLATGLGHLWSYDILSNTFDIIDTMDATTGDCESALMQASDDNIYWVSQNGGNFYGSILRYNMANNLIEVLHASTGPGPSTQEFSGATNNTLFEASNGKLYGCSKKGGDYDFGCLFKIDLNGSNYQTLHSFNDALTNIGFYPEGGFVENGGYLYSATTEVESLGLFQGSFFKVNLSTDAITFTNILDLEGDTPQGTFTESPNGRFYITCSGGGINNGSIVEMNPLNETIVQRHSFVSNDGTGPKHDKLCVVDFSSLSIDETSLIDDFVKTYPNPVQDILNIKITGSDKIETIKILDLKGSELYIDESKTKESVVNTSFLSSGVYLLYIKTNTGSITRKIVKE